MTCVTPASLAYVATQVVSIFDLTSCSDVLQIRFGLSSVPVFSRTDTVTDSEGFYTSILSLLEDPEEVEEVKNLFAWWDRLVQRQS
jgi:hypothetical protein